MSARESDSCEVIEVGVYAVPLHDRELWIDPGQTLTQPRPNIDQTIPAAPEPDNAATLLDRCRARLAEVEAEAETLRKMNAATEKGDRARPKGDG